MTVLLASRWSGFSNDELQRIEAALLRAHTLKPTGANMLIWSSVYDELDSRGVPPPPGGESEVSHDDSEGEAHAG